MRPTLPLEMAAEGKHIGDIHRKLASIRAQLKAKLTDFGYRFLCGKSTTIFDTQMQ